VQISEQIHNYLCTNYSLVILLGTNADLRKAVLRRVRFIGFAGVGLRLSPRAGCGVTGNLNFPTQILPSSDACPAVRAQFLEENRMKTGRNAIVLLAAFAFGASAPRPAG
jgi:hypothetical protein